MKNKIIFTKKILLFLTILSLGLFLLSSFTIFNFTPPGTEKIKMNGEKIYLDKTEVINFDWKEYLYYLKREYGEDSQKYQAALPDTTVWNTAYSESKGFNHLLPKLRNYPMVGITYEQAVNYCKWRSKVVNMKYNKGVKYALPSKALWKAVFNQIVSPKKNKKRASQLVETGKRVRHITHLTDNVSEMVQEKGIAVGMNYAAIQKNKRNLENETEKIYTTQYKNPTKYVGFRCVATFAEN